MVVTEIKPIVTKDGKPIWKVSLEGDDKPLWLQSEPTFSEGHELPKDMIQLSSKGNSYILKKDGKPRFSGKSPAELDQSARTMALSYSKDLCVAGKIGLTEILDYATTFYEWVKKPIIAEARKLGGVEH